MAGSHSPAANPRANTTRTDAFRIVGIVGSLRQGSFNRQLLNAAAALMPPGGELVEWRDLHLIPPFSEDDEASPTTAVLGLRRAVLDADAVLVVTPEYNASLPGLLKNALDWASRPFATNVLRGKPVAVIGASPSPGGTVRARADARKILVAIGAIVVDEGLGVPHAYRQFDSTDGLVDPELRGELTSVVCRLVNAGQGARQLAAA